jgi:hypothetical protein
MSQYLFCKKCNRRLWFNDTVLFVSMKDVRHGYSGGGGCVFFPKYTLNLSYIFIQKNPIFLYNFGQKWLDTLYHITYSHNILTTYKYI